MQRMLPPEKVTGSLRTHPQERDRKGRPSSSLAHRATEHRALNSPYAAHHACPGSTRLRRAGRDKGRKEQELKFENRILHGVSSCFALLVP